VLRVCYKSVLASDVTETAGGWRVCAEQRLLCERIVVILLKSNDDGGRELVLRCRDAVVTLLLHCCYTVVTLLLHCCYTVVTVLSP
jgi:hypothetical protein